MLTDHRRHQIELELTRIKAAQDAVYAIAGEFGHQEFRAFAGLIASYANCVNEALQQGFDYVGESNLAKIDPETTYYVGEKFGRTLGRFLANPDHSDALRGFLVGAGLVRGSHPSQWARERELDAKLAGRHTEPCPRENSPHAPCAVCEQFVAELREAEAKGMPVHG